MPGRDELIASLETEGLTVIEWTDDPSARYSEHAHTRDEVLIVLGGSITMVVEGREHTLGPGDRLDLHAGEKHTATVGDEGAHYLLGKS